MSTEAIIRVAADGLVVPIVLLGAYGLIFLVPRGERRYEVYCRVLMAGLTAYLFAKLIGFIYQPALMRPFQEMGVDAGASFLDNPGFPSDHALFVAAITLAVWFVTKNRPLTFILAVLTILVGLGRVLALVHSPLDIVGGFLIAGIGALWYFQPKSTMATIAK